MSDVQRPAGWIRLPLGDAGTWLGGGTPSKSNPRFWRDGTVPWVSPKDMRTRVIHQSEDRITEDAVEQSATKRVPARSVLIVTRSGILEHSLPVALTAVDVTLNQDMKAIVPRDAVDAGYIAWALEAHEQAILNGCRKAGTTVASIETSALQRFEVPVAPLAEQRRIVAALEEHLSELDVAVAGLERARAKAVRLRDSVIASFVLGREVSDALGTAFDATTWEWHELRTLGALKGGITKGQKRRDGDKLRAVPYLRVANVQRGHLDLSEMKTIEATEAEIAELRLKHGDVLFNEGGDRDKLGRGWVWQGELPECIHQNHVFRFRPDARRVDAKFLSYYGNSHGQRYFLEQGKQTTNLASINLTKLGALPVPVPLLSDQKSIVAAIDAAVSSAERGLAEIDIQLLRATRLRQSILKHAFEGKLVPQDPNDEPTSVLLDRIRAERESDAPRGPKSRPKAKTSRKAPRR